MTKAADDIACQLVINYLTRHGYGNIARLVKKKKKVLEFDLQGLDLSDLLDRSKPKNDERNKRKNCDEIIQHGIFQISLRKIEPSNCNSPDLITNICMTRCNVIKNCCKHFD